MMMGLGLIELFLVGGVLLVAVIIGAVVLVSKTGGPRQQQEQNHPAPRQILDARLARGEITQEEYNQLRSEIEA